jgi:very-short-patch-repair endonuclease
MKEIERDEKRAAYLKGLGIRVIRFENRVVFDSLELVLNSIRAALLEQEEGIS